MMFVPAHDNQIRVPLGRDERDFMRWVAGADHHVGGDARVKFAINELLQLPRVVVLPTMFLGGEVERPEGSRFLQHVQQGEVSLPICGQTSSVA
jgi:hypothetical protein